MPSVMRGGHAFSLVPAATIERSQFDRSHGHKTTFDEGYLYPIFVDEVLPGDTFHMSVNGFVRLATPMKPIMDNLYLDTFFFFVPNRLVWTHWVNFMGEKVNPTDSTVYTVPVFTAYTPASKSLSDYMGVPLAGANITHITLFHRAYNLIWNQWFRDENLQNSVVVDTDDGPDAIADYVLLKRGKRHDYFTSCLPWPQKGTAASLGLSGTVNVKGIAFNTAIDPTDGTPGSSLESGGSAPSGWAGWVPTTIGSNYMSVRAAQATAGGPPMITADVTGLGFTINDMRQAFQIQKMLERDARGGTRYIEMVKSHFGVTSPDSRLQRPEYLGGGTASIMVNPVAQTAPVQRKDDGTAITGSTPQANLAAIGTGAFGGHGFAKSFTEHGVIIGLACVRADLTYQQGLERMWKRSTRYDFFWPEFAHIGEQTVLNQEIYMKGDSHDTEVFGYQERYGEYRYKPSRISGLYRSAAAGTLEIWHLSQNFAALPTLAATFIEEPSGATGPLYRTLAVPTEPHFLADFWFNFKTARPMPVFSVPGLVDHF